MLKIAHLINERLKQLPKFKGCTGGEVSESKEAIRFPILGAVSLNGESVEVCLYLEDGFICRVEVSAGNSVKEKSVESVGLDNFNQALDVLIGILDSSVFCGSQDWISFCKMQRQELELRYEDYVWKNGRLLKIKSVLVDFGFQEIFCTIVFARKEKVFYALLTEKDSRCFAARFDSAEEGNQFYKDVQENYFLSKKGNKIHRLPKDVFYGKFFISVGILF